MVASGLATLLIAAVAAFFWPGVPMYDTVSQYGQVLSNEVDDWHPPIMVRLWQLLHPLGPAGAPMFVVQVSLYAFGFGLIVGALERAGRRGAAVAAFVVGASPLLFGWQMVVLKDTQMLGALVAATGICAHYRLANRRIPFHAVAAMAVLIAYATLVRTNAIFVTAPLIALLFGRSATIGRRALFAVAFALLMLASTPVINHRVFGASPSDIAKSQPIFDLAAIAVSTPDSPSVFTRAERAQIEQRHCAKAFFWDPLGDPTACAPTAQRLMAEPVGMLYLALARAIARHPLEYARHRLEHWNSTERWLVEAGLPDEAPPVEAEPNQLGLRTPSSSVAAGWQEVASYEAASPLGWPIVWTALSLILVPVAWRRQSEGAGGLALALLVSGLALEASFLVVSIASDVRYHLWPMIASPLALVLLSDGPLFGRRETIALASALILLAAAGVIARASLVPAPDSYQGMIHAASG